MTSRKCFVAVLLATLGLLVSACTISINGVDQTLDITPDTLTSAITGTSYQVQLETDVSRGDFRWQIRDGALPPGLSLDDNSGLIAGRPTAAGTYDFTVRATESSVFGRSGSRSYTLIVVQKLSVTFTLARAHVGVPYNSAPATITGGVPPYTAAIVGLPAGLDFDPDTLSVVGTPLTPDTGQRVALQVTDSGTRQQTANASATLVVSPVGVAITTEPPLARALLGQSYSVRLEATGGLQPLTWEVTTGVLPGSSLDSDRLRLNRSTGVISGTPGVRATTQTFTVTVTDDDSPPSTDEREYKIVVPIAVQTTALDPATDATAYNEALAAAGGLPFLTDASVGFYHWTLGASQVLPDGLSLDPNTGVISGTPSATSVTESFSVIATDNDTPATSDSRDLKLVVSVSITTASLPDATIGQAYTQTLVAAHGLAPYAWAISTGQLPPGLQLDATTGVISGTPAAGATTQTFKVRVSDSDSPASQQEKQFTLTVNP